MQAGTCYCLNCLVLENKWKKTWATELSILSPHKIVISVEAFQREFSSKSTIYHIIQLNFDFWRSHYSQNFLLTVLLFHQFSCFLYSMNELYQHSISLALELLQDRFPCNETSSMVKKFFWRKKLNPHCFFQGL